MATKTTPTMATKTTPTIEITESITRNNILLSAIDLITLERTINLPEYFSYNVVAFGAAAEGRWFILLRQSLVASARGTIFKIVFSHDRGELEKLLNGIKEYDYEVKFMRVHHATGVWAVLVESTDDLEG